MVKEFLRLVIAYGLALFVAHYAFEGVSINGGVTTYLIAAALMAFGMKFIRPVLLTITLPFQMLTFGLLGHLTALLVIALVLAFYQSIEISTVIFHGLPEYGLGTTGMRFNHPLSYGAISATIYVIASITRWVFDD